MADISVGISETVGSEVTSAIQRKEEGLIEAAKLVRVWLEPEGHDVEFLDYVVLLDEEFLREKECKCGVEWPPCGKYGNVSNEHWRYRYRKEMAYSLGWRTRREEFDPEGFPPRLNDLLRDDIWPRSPKSPPGSQSSASGASLSEGSRFQSSHSQA